MGFHGRQWSASRVISWPANPGSRRFRIRRSFPKASAQLKRTLKVTYHADGTYTTSMNQSELDGTWKLNWNSSKIISTSDKGEKKEYTILSLTSDKFEFKAMEGQSEVIFVMVPGN